MNELDLFAAAIAIAEPTERNAWLDRECIGRPELRKRLKMLLDQHVGTQQLLDRPNATDRNDATALMPEKSLNGTVLAGRYKLLEQIGDGGMGTVWMAEQREPVKRLVAVKLIKPGMDSSEVLARFSAERQALALMDHPNIAKVHDAGTDENGRPYFVMELVKGLPLNEYSDARKLTINERLNLFVQICSAVQHAHQKAVIHRDLKPSNVLVTEHDGHPVPKVIDFGLAKALNPSQMLTDRTLHTAYGTVVGTPLYMAPEQVGINALDVDTRTDIYALGVILYELLTGTTPLEKARFKEAAWEEVKRLIREEEPPRPSTRLSSDKTLPNLAASRQVDPGQLRRQVQGELDWIVMKALDKDRGRRYETATGLAKDVQRFLAGEAVEACPPTLGYRLKKLYRKHRVAITTTCLVAAVLIVGITVSTWQAIRATRLQMAAWVAQAQAEAALKSEANQRRITEKASEEATKASEATKNAFLVLDIVLNELDPYKHPTPPTLQEALVKACEKLDSMPDLTPTVRAGVRGIFGGMLMKLHLYKEGQEQLKNAAEELAEVNANDPGNLETLATQEKYAQALITGRQIWEDLKLAEKTLEQVLAARVKFQGEGHPDTLRTMTGPLASAIFYQGDDAFFRIEKLLRLALAAALDNPDLGDEHEQTSYIRSRLANILTRSGEPENLNEARDLCNRVIEFNKKKHGENDFRTLGAKLRLVKVKTEETDVSESAKEMYDLTLRFAKAVGSDEFALSEYDSLAVHSLAVGEVDHAGYATKKLLQHAPDQFGKGHPSVRRCHGFRAWYLVNAEEYPEAEEEAKKVFSADFAALDQLAGGWDDAAKRSGYEALAACILRRQPRDKLTEEEFKQAEEYLRQAEEVLSKMPKHLDSPSRLRVAWHSRNLRLWIELYEKWGKPELAVPYQEKLKQLNP